MKEQDPGSVPLWRVGLSAARLLLGLLCLAAQISSPQPVVKAVSLLALVYAIHAAFGLLMGGYQRITGLALLSLFLDAVFFLVFARWGHDPGLWLSSAFFLFLMLEGILEHGPSDLLIVWGGSTLFLAIAPWPEAAPLRRLVLFGGALATAVAYEKGRLEQRLEQLRQEAERQRAEAEKARLEERQRIAGDFHDGPLQEFIGMQIQLDILRRLLERDRQAALEELRRLQELARRQVTELRSFLRGMRPQPVEGTDVVAFARRLAEDFQKDTGIPVRFSSSEVSLHTSPELCQEIMLILREALKNIQKHSHAGRVSVSIRRAGKDVELSVDDNGAGFGFSGTFTLEELELLELGPQSIKRRVRSLGGELVLESRPGQGSGLRIRIPA
ncbi:MAG: sensor histidine kinase [Bryobacterales bacterium]|nr:sensor histidine kinase [Bryobacteraceae bacterium]MDW8131303.1 sensor histidine kinase [Bryobacterales bacterium]